ncbi:MAG TPA: SRPBCC domain-containing protein [Gaiellaceae bacterium]|nr:SRPBCC domain-containing protein [Gaiellaceae bacterium]
MDDTCALRLTRSYDAAPEVVWATLIEPASRARWLGPIAGTLDACVRAAEPARLLELDWAPPGEPPSVVRFELRADGEGTELVLDHRRLDAQLGMRALRLWEGHLSRLDALLGAGAE